MKDLIQYVEDILIQINTNEIIFIIPRNMQVMLLNNLLESRHSSEDSFEVQGTPSTRFPIFFLVNFVHNACHFIV